MPDLECPSHADLSAFNLGGLPVAVLDGSPITLSIVPAARPP